MPRVSNLKGPGPGRPKGVPNKATQEIKELARAWTTGDPEWVASARVRMSEGKAPHLETYLLQMGHGKPKDTLEVQEKKAPEDSADLSKLSVEELERLQQLLRKVEIEKPPEQE